MIPRSGGDPPPPEEKCSAGLAFQALRLFKIFAPCADPKVAREGMERPQGYKANPALQDLCAGTQFDDAEERLDESVNNQEPQTKNRVCATQGIPKEGNMKPRMLVLTSAITVFAALATPVRQAAQAPQEGADSASNVDTGITNDPVPLINQPLVPEAARPGGTAFTLTVNGTGFVSGSVLHWNGSARTTTFVSGSKLTASILASDLATAGTASVTAVNPGGGTSNVAFFSITVAASPLAFNESDLDSGGGGADSVATADFNGDGKVDFVVANNLNSNVSVHLGNGDGTFQPEVSYTTDAFPDSVVVGDFNGDGKLDLAVRSSSSFTISVLLGNGDGTFQPFKTTPTAACQGRLAEGDLNGDGKLVRYGRKKVNFVSFL